MPSKKRMSKQGKTNQNLILLGKKVVNEIEKGRNPVITLPVRSLSNIKFNKTTKRLGIGRKMAKRYFFNIAHAKKFLQTIEIASISKTLTSEGKHASLRDVFYMVKRTISGTSVNLVDEQQESDAVIEDLELITEDSRELMNINANKMGSVAGKVIVEDLGDVIDWSKMGSGGWSIPSNVEEIKFKKVDAKYIIYMEKQAVWERLHEDKFWDKENCLIVTSQGQTTRGIRRLLQRLHLEYKLPIYVLTDFDPWGFYIYSVLKFGSIGLAHIADKLAIPDVKFLGITADDIENYDLKKHFIQFKESDSSRLGQISGYEWFKANKEWQRQLSLMKKYKDKAEIQVLSYRGISCISEKYLPEKIKKKQWID